MAFSSLDPARYRATNKRTVTVLTIRCEGTEATIGPSQERLNFFARHRLRPLQASDNMNDHHDDTQYLQVDLVLDDECSRNWTTCVARRGAPLIHSNVATTSQQQPSYPPPQGMIVVDLLWVHLPPSSSSTSATSAATAARAVDRSKDDDELRLIDFIGFAMDPSSGMLHRGGSVIALSGSNRERSHEQQQHERAQQTTSPSFRMARDVTEPMLRFILDVTMLLMTAGGPSRRRKNAKYPWRPSANTSSIVFRALKSVGEVSLDANGGAMLLRMMERD